MENLDPTKLKIVYAYRGSKAHNMYIDPGEPMGTDDIDYIGVWISPIDYYLGLHRKENYESFVGTDDIVMYDIIKFFRLLLKSNPNVLSLLWNRPDMIIESSWQWDMIIRHRDLFSSKQAVNAFHGYAQSQIKKMHTSVFQGYMGAKRKKIVEQFGFDTKNASHLIRLLRMGHEFLKTGKMTVYRTDDRDELIAIKRGEWTLDRVVNEAEQLFQGLDDVVKASPLPDKIDVERVNLLLTKIMSIHFDVSPKKFEEIVEVTD